MLIPTTNNKDVMKVDMRMIAIEMIDQTKGMDLSALIAFNE